ncbi:MAG: head-tail adaptor protein [Acidimicrobiia bacterium]|nr:head-tail adaptor protein [Acidimicrobiia bacterium]
MTLHDRFRVHTAAVERRSRTATGAGGWTESWSSVGSVEGSLQPGGASSTTHGDQELAEARWVFYCDLDADIARDDRLTVDGTTYTVQSVERWEANTVVDHLAVVLEELQVGT